MGWTPKIAFNLTGLRRYFEPRAQTQRRFSHEKRLNQLRQKHFRARKPAVMSFKAQRAMNHQSTNPGHFLAFARAADGADPTTVSRRVWVMLAAGVSYDLWAGITTFERCWHSSAHRFARAKRSKVLRQRHLRAHQRHDAGGRYECI